MNDLISRQEAIDIERRSTVDTNPEHFEAHEEGRKHIQKIFTAWGHEFYR